MKSSKKVITARFKSFCAETGSRILRGEQMLYDYDTRKCYCMNSQMYKNFVNASDNDAESLRAYIDAQECAMFERYN